MKDLKKVQHFIILIFIDLLPVLQHIFPVATTMFRYGAGSGAIINWPSGSVSVIQDYRSKDPDLTERHPNNLHVALCVRLLIKG